MAASHPARLWVTVIGIVLIGACWVGFAWAISYGYYYGWSWFGDATSPAFEVEMNGVYYGGTTHLAVLILLLCTGGYWIGAWAVTTFLHKQSFWSLVSPAKRINWRWFGVGVLISAGELGIGLVWSLVFPGEPLRFNQPDLVQWALFALPIAALVFIQAGAEELVFRGYLMQRLAARFRNPLIWLFVPTVLFGAMHYANADTVEYGLYYVASTALFGLSAAILVWRTGDLSAAIGWHVANNIVSLLVAGVDDYFIASPLWLASVDQVIAGMPVTLCIQLVILAFVLSPWGPKAQPARRNETRAAP